MNQNDDGLRKGDKTEFEEEISGFVRTVPRKLKKKKPQNDGFLVVRDNAFFSSLFFFFFWLNKYIKMKNKISVTYLRVNMGLSGPGTCKSQYKTSG